MLTETSDRQREMKKRRKTCIQMNMNLKKCCEEGVFVLSLFLYVSSEAHLSFLHTNNCATKVTGTGNTIDDKVRASDQPVARIHLIFLTTSQQAWHSVMMMMRFVLFNKKKRLLNLSHKVIFHVKYSQVYLHNERLWIYLHMSSKNRRFCLLTHEETNATNDPLVQFKVRETPINDSLASALRPNLQESSYHSRNVCVCVRKTSDSCQSLTEGSALNLHWL